MAEPMVVPNPQKELHMKFYCHHSCNSLKKGYKKYHKGSLKEMPNQGWGKHISVPWKCQKKCTMLFRDKWLQSSLQKIVTFMFQALVLVQNIVTSAWHFYLCCTALFCLLLYPYSIVTHSEAENCHFDVSGFYREAKYLHFLPVLDKLIKGT